MRGCEQLLTVMRRDIGQRRKSRVPRPRCIPRRRNPAHRWCLIREPILLVGAQGRPGYCEPDPARRD